MTEQMELLFDGPAYDADRDQARLTGQCRRVFAATRRGIRHFKFRGSGSASASNGTSASEVMPPAPRLMLTSTAYRCILTKTARPSNPRLGVTWGIAPTVLQVLRHFWEEVKYARLYAVPRTKTCPVIAMRL